MVADALRSWVLPTLAGAAAACFWFFDVAGLVDEAHAVTAIGISLFVLVLFTSCRHYLFDEGAAARQGATLFVVAWTLLILVSFWRHNFPGAPLAAGMLRVDGPALDLPAASRYALVIDGSFPPGTPQSNRIGQYRLELAADGIPPQPVVGQFEDKWSQRRLGRRGTAPVEVQHTTAEHVLRPKTNAPQRLRLVEIDSTLKPEIAVSVYPAIPPWLFPVLGGLGLLAVLTWEKRVTGDGSALMAACVTFFVADIYVDWVPHPALQPFIGAVLMGGIFGAPLAAALWRLLPRRWFLAMT